MPPRLGTGDHIGRVNFPALYADAFGGNTIASKDFYEKVKAAAKAEADAHLARTPARRAKQLLHDAARLIWLGDQIDRPDIAIGRPGLQVHFYIIAAEMVAKRWADFRDEGQSKKHVLLFFEKLCNEAHRKCLSGAFRPKDDLLAWDEAVQLLYGVRCDVAHEGRYHNFAMADYPGEGMLWVDVGANGEAKAVVQVNLTVDELRQIILEGTVEAAKQLVP